MYCPVCGGQNDDGSVYCVTCGAKLPKDTAEPVTNGSRPDAPTVKQRHGCLTAYLIVMIIITSLAVIAVPASLSLTGYLQEGYQDWAIPVTWATWVSLAANVAQIAFAVAIFKWKRWGVYAFVAATVVELVLSGIATEGMSSIPGIPDDLAAFSMTIGIIVSIIIGVLTIALLVVALKMGKPSGWEQLE